MEEILDRLLELMESMHTIAASRYSHRSLRRQYNDQRYLLIRILA